MADIRDVAFEKVWEHFDYIAQGTNMIMFKNECILVLGVL